MNDKLAKMLRHHAQYRNQSATPATMPFPGVARMYSVPVYQTRERVKPSYAILPLLAKPIKVFTTLRRMILDHKGRPIPEMDVNPTTGAKTPRTELVPVSKPARLDPTSAKGKYRALKRLARKQLLQGLGAAILAAYQPKEVTP